MASRQQTPSVEPPAGERPEYLTEQLITCIGNKRALLPFIGRGVDHARAALGKERLRFLDLFAGSGVVSRYAKQFSDHIVANDLEAYSAVVNRCYLTNEADIDLALIHRTVENLRAEVRDRLSPGFITELYSPADEDRIGATDRVFYTRRNAIYIDTARRLIDEISPHLRSYVLAPLLAAASVHANTAGVFKGFYKNGEGIGQFGGAGRQALVRIRGAIELQAPVFSRFSSTHEVMQEDANALVREFDPVDVAYFDPPYNQHPYGSNYFMLNLITAYERPASVSRVSGIPDDWNRSNYNSRKTAEAALFDAVENCRASFILISYNSEGFVEHGNFVRELQRCGEVSVMDTEYNTFRGCRNLGERDLRVTEFLYLVDKRQTHGRQ
jgi:adenine-specific DNA-methyltransferase